MRGHPQCPFILFTLWQPHRNSLAFSVPIKPIPSIFTPSAQPNASLSCICVCAAALMAQGLADRWRFSSVDESAGLVMTSRLCYPIIPCPAPYPRSPRPVPPHREGMMGWWMIGAVGEGRENDRYTVTTFVLHIFSLYYSKHTRSLLLLYTRKQIHAQT